MRRTPTAPSIGQPATVAIALGALVAGTVFSVNAALIVVLAGLVGIVVFAGRLRAPKAAGGVCALNDA